ncbi:MAG TPA: TIGR03435 family protein [Acidobacteriaceae bacterium]
MMRCRVPVRFRVKPILMLAAGWMVVFGVGTMGLGQAGAQGQSTASAPVNAKRPLAFEVVSIRPYTAASGPVQFGQTPDGYHSIGLPLFAIFQDAYAPPAVTGVLRGDRIIGAPDWLMGEHYDIVAKVGEADLADWQKPELKQAMLRAMLRTMLADRCNVAVHHASKEVPVYDLVLAKGGPKFKAAEITDPVELKQKHPSGGRMIGGGMAMETPNGTRFYGVSMMWLGDAILTNMAGRPVVDKTGLTGRYDLELPRAAMPQRIAAGVSQADEHPASQSLEAPPPPPPPAEPASIFTLLPESLGLRLEPAKGQVETLVIDHVDRPTAN